MSNAGEECRRGMLVMTLTDPKTYTKPWVSERKVFKLAPANVEIQELFCVPSEEESFNQRVRDPAGLSGNRFGRGLHGLRGWCAIKNH